MFSVLILHDFFFGNGVYPYFSCSGKIFLQSHGDNKNVFIANKDYDITKNLIELIDNQIKNVEIK